MAEKLSTGLCDILLASASMKTAFTTPEIRIFSGTVPLTADDADTGTVIALVKEGGGALTWAASSVGGVLSKSASAWTSPTGSTVGGIATHYRLCNTADTNASSTVLPRIQGTVSAGGGGDMVVGNTTIGAATVFTIDYYTQSIVPT